MFKWHFARLRNRNRSPLEDWSVRLEDDDIVTSDGSETTHRIAIAHLQKVVVRTDDSGPWGADVVYFLFADDPQPAGVFPIEAEGCQEFVNWLGTRPGFNDRELARAMGSTNVAEFVVYESGR